MAKEKIGKLTSNLLLTFLCIVIASIGMSLTLKADIGVGSVNALSTTLGEILNIKVGTILIFINASFVLIQLVLQRNDFHWRQWLQLGVSYVLGETVNIFYYNVFSKIEVHNYIMSIFIFIIGLVISSFAIGLILQLNLVAFPIESMCNVVAKIKNWQFKHIRQSIDVIFIISTIILMLLFSTSLSIREGTILNLIILGPVSQFFLHITEKWEFINRISIK